MQLLKGKKVLVLGDSIMNGSGNNDVGVGEFLVSDLGFKLIKYCYGGARVGWCEGKDWIVEQVRRAIKNGENPDLIIFDGFTNDCNKTDGVHCDVPFGESKGEERDVFEVTEKDTFSQCFNSVTFSLKKYFKNAEIVFVRPHRMGRREEAAQVSYGERAVEICKKRGITVVDLYKDSGIDTFIPEHRDKYTADSYGWGRGDCTHPNEICYKEIYMPLIEKAVIKLFEVKL